MDKKIAICFSGAIRSFETCIPTIQKYMLNNLKPDIFIHMWIIKNIDKSLNTTFKIRKSNIEIENVLNILNPKDYVIDKYDSSWEEKILKESGLKDHWNTIFNEGSDRNYASSALGMYYKINKCNELKKKYETTYQFKYDCVIRARLDYIFCDHVNIDDIFPIIPNQIIIIKDRYNELNKKTKYCNDKFFIGTSEDMDKLCNIFYDIKTCALKNVCKIEGQSLMLHQIKKYNLDVKRIGNRYIYYKCQGRHEIKKCSITYFIPEINNNILQMLAYNLLRLNYQVFTYKCDYNYILISKNFKIVDYNDTNKYKNVILYDDQPIPKVKGLKYLLINSTIKDIPKNSSQYIISDSATGLSAWKAKGTPQACLPGRQRGRSSLWSPALEPSFGDLEKIIKSEEIVDFIMSTKNLVNKYFFSKSKLVKPKINDQISYQIPDRGFYKNTIEKIENNEYYLKNEVAHITKLKRNEFKIVNLHQYYEEGILPSNYSK